MIDEHNSTHYACEQASISIASGLVTPAKNVTCWL